MIINKITLSSINRYIYILVCCINTCVYILSNASLNNLQLKDTFNTIGYGVYIVLIVQGLVALTNLTTRKITFLLIGIPVIFFITIFSGYGLIKPFLFILAYPNKLSSKKLCGYLCKIALFSILCVLVLGAVGIFSDITIYRNGLLRHSLGFLTPNTYGNLIILALFLKIYSAWDSWKLFDTVVWIFIILFTYTYANSRASFYLGIVILIAILFYRHNYISEKLKKIIYKLPAIVFFINSILSIWAPMYFSKHLNNSFSKLNELFSGRLHFMIYFFNRYGISFFGNKNAKVVGTEDVLASNGALQWLGLDNSYLYLAVFYGIASLICFFVIYYFAQKNVENEDNWGGVLYLILFAIFGLTENIMRTATFNFSILIFAEYLVANNISSFKKYDLNK